MNWNSCVANTCCFDKLELVHVNAFNREFRPLTTVGPLYASVISSGLFSILVVYFLEPFLKNPMSLFTFYPVVPQQVSIILILVDIVEVILTVK